MISEIREGRGRWRRRGAREGVCCNASCPFPSTLPLSPFYKPYLNKSDSSLKVLFTLKTWELCKRAREGEEPRGASALHSRLNVFLSLLPYKLIVTVVLLVLLSFVSLVTSHETSWMVSWIRLLSNLVTQPS